MNILIVGANGYIGSNLIKQLAKNKNDNITALVNGPDFYNVQKIKNVKFLLFDYSDNLYNLINDSFDVVVNLAWVGVNGANKSNKKAQQSNIIFLKKLLNVAIKKNIKRVVITGTISEHFASQYINEKNNGATITYGFFKNKAKELCKRYAKSSLNITWLQLANVYGGKNLSGNILSLVINFLVNNKPIELSSGNQFYDFIYINDLVNAIKKAIKKDLVGFNELYLGSGCPKLLKDYLSQIGDVYERKDLLLFGKRLDDSLIFDISWMDNSSSIKILGNYVKSSFYENIVKEKNIKRKSANSIAVFSSFLVDSLYIYPFIQNDERGFFIKDYQYSKIKIKQFENFYTFSKKNVMRGMHYQPVNEQGKIVSCVNGAILDVIIDLRKDSNTFLQKQYAILSDKNHTAIYVPPGFAHGFLALENATVLYRCNKEFNPRSDLGFNLFDSSVNIHWGINQLKSIVSKKDKQLDSLTQLLNQIEIL